MRIFNSTDDQLLAPLSTVLLHISTIKMTGPDADAHRSVMPARRVDAWHNMAANVPSFDNFAARISIWVERFGLYPFC